MPANTCPGGLADKREIPPDFVAHVRKFLPNMRFPLYGSGRAANWFENWIDGTLPEDDLLDISGCLGQTIFYGKNIAWFLSESRELSNDGYGFEMSFLCVSCCSIFSIVHCMPVGCSSCWAKGDDCYRSAICPHEWTCRPHAYELWSGSQSPPVAGWHWVLNNQYIWCCRWNRQLNSFVWSSGHQSFLQALTKCFFLSFLKASSSLSASKNDSCKSIFKLPTQVAKSFRWQKTDWCLC